MESVRSGRHDSVRATWLDQVVRELQCAAPQSVSRDRHGARALIAASTAAIPEAGNYLEQLLLRSILLEFAWRFGRTFHSQFHGPPNKCRFSSSAIVEQAWRNKADGGTTILSRWADLFFGEFDRTHPLSTTERAAKLIQEQYHQPCHVRDLAAKLSVGPSQLAREFLREYGISVKKYQRLLRIIEGVEHLRHEKVEAIAFQVGFKSRKDFTRGFEGLTGMTPTQFKRLPAEQAKDVIEATRVLLVRTRLRLRPIG